MKQEDKELLLKDLCARLPYKCVYSASRGITHWNKLILNIDTITKLINNEYDDIKPYLRPMESMTEEEKEEYEKLCILIPTQFDSDLQKYDYYTTDSMESFDWLLKNHFDVRDLIEKGLAIAVTEENKPYEG